MPKTRVRNATPAAGSGPLAIHLERRAARAEAELRTWKDKYKHAIRELEDADHRLDIALGLDGKQRPQIPKVRASTTKKQTEGVIVAVCSDWHVGELVNPRAINGLNKYDPNIARDSIRAMTDGFLEKLADIRHGTTVNSMVLALLGDLMTGYIHEELVESNTMSPTEEMDFLQDELCLMIERLWGTGKLRELVIPCMYGNHGRTTTKKRILTGAKNSFEWFVYRTIAKVFRNEPKIRFEIGDGDQVYVDVFDNYRIRCIHGDQVTYNGGQGGITVPLKKKVDKWDKGIRANVTLLGHFHTFVDYQYAVINGSLIGYNSFAQHLGFEYEPPQQGLLLIDKEQNRKVGTWTIQVR